MFLNYLILPRLFVETPKTHWVLTRYRSIRSTLSACASAAGGRTEAYASWPTAAARPCPPRSQIKTTHVYRGPWTWGRTHARLLHRPKYPWPNPPAPLLSVINSAGPQVLVLGLCRPGKGLHGCSAWCRSASWFRQVRRA